MKRGHALILTQGLAAAAILGTVSWAYPGAWPTVAGLSRDISLLLVLAAALVVLAVADRGFPEGSSVRTTVAIAFCAAVLFQPAVATAVLLAGQLAGTRHGAARGSGWAVAEATGRYAVLVSLGWSALAGGLPDRLLAAPASPAAILLLCVSAAAFAFADSALFQVHVAVQTDVPYLPLLAGGLRRQGWLLLADASVAAISLLLYPTLRTWGFLITVPVLLVMRQSFMILLDVQSSYRSTIEALARAIAAYDLERRGHAESVAAMAAEAGGMLGMSGRRLQDLTHAALLHDAGLLGTDGLDGDPVRRRSASVAEGVGFLAGVVPILRALDLEWEPAETPKKGDLLAAYVIACCSEIDSESRMGEIELAGVAETLGKHLPAGRRQSADAVLRSVRAGRAAGPPAPLPQGT